MKTKIQHHCNVGCLLRNEKQRSIIIVIGFAVDKKNCVSQSVHNTFVYLCIKIQILMIYFVLITFEITATTPELNVTHLISIGVFRLAMCNNEKI